MACKGCEARKRFLINGVTSAATTLHAKYLKPAREFLEAVKQQMGFGGLDQLTQRYENEEGVKFTASSRFGQDEMIIDVPKPPEGPVPEEKPKEKVVPYLWVGARIVYTPTSNVTPGSFELMVMEPGNNGVLCENWQVGSGFSTALHLRVPSSGTYDPLDIADQTAGFYEQRPWVPLKRLSYMAKDVNGGVSNFQYFTKRLMRHYSINFITASELNLIQPPHDPKETDELIAARVPSQYGSFGTETLWDQVVVCDPDEGGAKPTSMRPLDKETLGLLSEATGIAKEDCIISGNYIVKVMAVGTNCKASTVAAPYAYGWNEDLTDYPDPMTIEVEVRVGKAPNTITKRYTTVISAYSEIFRDMHPFGDFNAVNVVACIGGSNPHNTCWSQSAILANPMANSISIVNTVPDAFAPNDVPLPICARQYWDIYVAVFQPWCAYATGTYDTEAANLIYNALIDTAHQGLWGAVDAPQITEAQIAAAASGVIDPSTGEGLYHYNYATNIFTKFAAGSYNTALSTQDPVDATHEIWEDEFRWQSITACRGFAKVRFGNGEDFDSTVHVDDPAWVQEIVTANCGCLSYNDSNAWHEVGQP